MFRDDQGSGRPPRSTCPSPAFRRHLFHPLRPPSLPHLRRPIRGSDGVGVQDQKASGLYLQRYLGICGGLGVAEGDGRQLRVDARSGNALRTNERWGVDAGVDGIEVDGLVDVEEESCDEDR